MSIRSSLSVAVVALCTLAVGACASGSVTTGAEIQQEMDLPEYDGPKASVAVGPCSDKSGGAMNFAIEQDGEARQFSFSSQVGQGMADMLVTGLLNTGRFRVLETGAIEALEKEQQLAGEEAQGKMEGADLLVTCAVTSAEPNAGGALGAVTSVAGDVLGVGGAGLEKSEITLDIRIVDVESRAIVTAFSASGTATDAGVGGILAGGGAAGGLGAYSNTSIEGAVKKAVLKASEHIAKATPKEYFAANP